MKKVIFIDFDGVLNTENYQAQLRRAGKPQWDDFEQVFDPDAVENLRMILKTVPDVILVINSSWKLEGLERMKDMWKSRNLPGKIDSITPDYVPSLKDIDLDNYDNIELLSGKGNEVKQWISENSSGKCKYVIIDDVPDFLPEQEPYLIYTDPRIGITKEDSMRAITLLQ